MSRYALTFAVAALALGGMACGGTYYEHDGLVQTGPPAVTYADPAAAVGVSSDTQATTYYSSDEVQVGASETLDYEDTDPSAVTEFRTTLDPYGTWVEDGTYGTVWVPSTVVVGADFAPYVTSGHWVYENEYIWVSDYDWGWAPFHYGRWTWISGRGWAWIPGRRYAGAWVSWRVGYDGWGYVGWSPLAPTWYWHHGMAVAIGFAPPVHPWVYCAHGDVFHPMVGTRLVASGQVSGVAAHTRPWVPAQPSVGGGGRGLANPSVNAGPPPGQLGINNAPRMPAGHAGLLKAQGYARPSTAASYGARPPQMAVARSGLPNRDTLAPIVRGPTALPSNGTTYTTRTAPTEIRGGNDAYTTRPQPSWRPQPNADGSASFRPQPNTGTPTQTFRPTYTPPAQAYRPAPTPQYTAPQYTAPSYSTPSFSHTPSTGGFGGGYSAPSVHSTPSGGGGFSTPSFRSAPSVGGGGSHVAPARPSTGGGGSVMRRR